MGRDSFCRVTSTTQAVYLDAGAPGTLDLNPAALDANGNAQIAEPVYQAVLITSQTHYDPATGLQDWSADHFGNITRYTYDAERRLIRTLYPDGTETRTVYDVLGRVIWATDRYKTNTTYDATTGAYVNDNTTAALATHTVYDALGRVVSTGRYQGVVVSLGSQSFGSVSLPESTLTGGGSPISSTGTFYNSAGQAVESVDAAGLRTGTIYYSDGQVEYTGPLLSTMADGASVAGTPWWSTLPANPDPTQIFSSYTTYLYNQVDPVTGALYDRVVDADGHHTDTYNDLSGRVVKTVADDGSSTQTLYGVGNNPVGYHQVDGQTIAGSQSTSVDQLGNATDSFYDAAGNLTDVYEPSVEDVSSSFDAASGAVTVTDNGSSRPHWRYTYDAYGDQLTQTDPNGHTTTFIYDELGRETSRTLPGGETETFTYDAYGRTLTHTDFDGQTTAYVYDDSATGGGREEAEYRFAAGVAALDANGNIRTAYAAEHTVYGYDSLGRQTGVTEYTGSTLTRQEGTTYDPITGQIASESSPEGTIHYAYDPVTGEKIEAWTDSGTDTHYSYTLEGQLYQVTATELAGQTLSTPQVTTYGYDAVGNLVSDAQPDGITTAYHYDDLNRLTDETAINTATGNAVFYQHYTLQKNGLRSEDVETRYNANGSVFSQVEYKWSYDNLGRLTEESLTPTFGKQNAPAAYDDVFRYDLANNRTEEDINGGAANAFHSAEPGWQVVDYGYDSDDQLLITQATSDTNPGDPGSYQILYGHYTSGGVFVKGYDANGSLLEQHRTGVDPEDDSYTWDLRNRMASATVATPNATGGGSTTATTTYGYNSGGVRVRDTTGGQNTYYLIDPTNPTGYAKAIEEKSSLTGIAKRSYVLGLKVEGQSDANEGSLYLLTDGHGSTRDLVNLSGNIVQRFDYDAFGAALDFNPATAQTPWLFGGDGTYDPASGFTYQLARWRNGFTFISFDPSENDPASPKDLHKYLYAGGDPEDFSDPSGYLEEEEAIGEDIDLDEAEGDLTAQKSIKRQVQLIYGFLVTSVLAAIVGFEGLLNSFDSPGNPGILPDGENPQNPGYRYFVHGGTTAPSSGGPTDFGDGYYAFAADIRGITDAKQWALRVASMRGGTPFIEVKSITDANYSALHKITLAGNSVEWLQSVTWYRQQNAAQGGPFSDYDLIIGPLATKGGGGWRPVQDSPDQYAFKSTAANELVLVNTVDLGN